MTEAAGLWSSGLLFSSCSYLPLRMGLPLPNFGGFLKQESQEAICSLVEIGLRTKMSTNPAEHQAIPQCTGRCWIPLCVTTEGQSPWLTES
jgi:hypothetical protein